MFLLIYRIYFSSPRTTSSARISHAKNVRFDLDPDEILKSHESCTGLEYVIPIYLQTRRLNLFCTPTSTMHRSGEGIPLLSPQLFESRRPIRVKGRPLLYGSRLSKKLDISVQLIWTPTSKFGTFGSQRPKPNKSDAEFQIVVNSKIGFIFKSDAVFHDVEI